MTYSVTVHIANRGTLLKNGDTSSVGHMWYEINDYKSKPTSYGFAPAVEGRPWGEGRVYNNDSDNYQSTSYSRTIEITKEQYDKLKDFGENHSDYGFSSTYNGLNNSCIDFTWKALNVGGINPVADFEGLVWPTWNEPWVKQLQGNEPLFPYGDNGHQCLKPWQDEVNRDGKYHVYDPLVLDLDGDGIETVGTNGYAGALFDHNSDGIRTATGWILSDDGLLVIDRNGDGVINDGTELFGDGYVLSDGTKAEHGYAALAEFDTNGDGKVDSEDADFDKLKVWRDLNQDGISQAGELFTLAEVGVASLNVAYQDVNQRLGNGNTIAQKGSYTTADGETRKMGDLLLAADHLHSRYSDSIELTEEQMQAANVQGIGRLRDLREAAALSPKLVIFSQIFKQIRPLAGKAMPSEKMFQTA